MSRPSFRNLAKVESLRFLGGNIIYTLCILITFPGGGGGGGLRLGGSNAPHPP